jgi:hypothetical protein
MANTIDDARPHTGLGVIHTRSPHDPARHVPVDTLLAWWTDTLRRTVQATAAGHPVDVEDYWTELAVGTRLAQEVTAGRWVVVARLLRAGAISDWHEVGTALNMTGLDAAAGFTVWLAGQVDLYRRMGIGLTAAEAEDLAHLAAAVGGEQR